MLKGEIMPMLKLSKRLKPYTLPIAVVCALMLLQSLSQLYLPNLMSDIVDKGVARKDTAYIWRVGGLMLLVALGGAVCTIIANYLSSRNSMGFGRDLRSAVFARVESFSLHEFDQIGTASLITRTTNDITQVQNVVMMSQRMLVTAPMMLIGGSIMAFSKDRELSKTLVWVLPLLLILVSLVATKGMPLFKAMQSKLDRLNLVLREGLTGIRVIRAFNRVDHESQRFDAANRDLTDTAIRVNRIMAVMMPLMMLIMNFTAIGIIWFGGIRINSGAMEVGDMMAFIQYAMQIMSSLLMVSMMFVMIPRASASAVRVNQVLETVPDISDPAIPATPTGQRGLVEFRDVSFSYPGAERPALQRISFTARPGQTTAIVGGTGAGKSTLISLIPRFYDISQGSILVDGVDVRQLTQADLRQKIGLVTQTAILFSGSVSDNIRYGRAEADDAEVQLATAVAQASEFVGGMPDGFASPLAQGGTNLSGGQKQRLSIARALVRRPEIYLFDDSFSALDFKTDARLRAALSEYTEDATVLIVAQRVSTVMDADQIIVLEDGQIAGIGTHRELLQSSTVYREIVMSQLSEEELA